VLRRSGRLTATTTTWRHMSTIALRDGWSVPAIGYGLSQIPPAEAAAATRTAIELGYRHLDSASFYANKKDVGQGIRDSNVARGELFVASKVWTDVIDLGGMRTSITLLGVAYLDCCYLHWPCAGHADAYRALERATRRRTPRALNRFEKRPRRRRAGTR